MSGLYPTGGDSTGGEGEEIYSRNVTSGFDVTLRGDGIASLVMGDILDLSTDTFTVLIKTLVDRVNAIGSPLGILDAHASASDSMRFSSALGVIWQILAADELDLIGTAAGQPARLAAIIDTLHATGAVTTRLDALAVVATTLAINGMLATGWKLDTIDSIGFQDALAGHLTALRALLDSAGFGDTTTPAMRITAVMADSIGTDEVLGTNLQAFEVLREDVLFYAVIRLGASEYFGWVLNEGAPSQYTNFPFNGFVQFAGKYYGTAADGLYLLEGDDDAGTPIDVAVRTALMDFGTGKRKRIPEAYLAFAGDGTVVLKAIVTDDNGAQSEHWYTATLPAGSQMHNGRVKLGRGLDSVYWQFELTNVDGSYLDVDTLAFHPLILDRRL